MQQVSVDTFLVGEMTRGCCRSANRRSRPSSLQRRVLADAERGSRSEPTRRRRGRAGSDGSTTRGRRWLLIAVGGSAVHLAFVTFGEDELVACSEQAQDFVHQHFVVTWPRCPVPGARCPVPGARRAALAGPAVGPCNVGVSAGRDVAS